jgi:glycosyltransferase involved in cell wall biosynthesis
MTRAARAPSADTGSVAGVAVPRAPTGCPTLLKLPAPPADRTGWPWTEETPPLPARRTDGGSWPRVSIVTPSYNQAEFLEATLRSLLLQGYPDLELIVIDGGSMDGSVDILRKYGPWLAHWCSEPDRGQSHAINKGFRLATGNILAWLNSDDIYFPGTLQAAAETIGRTGCDIFVGAMEKVELGEDGPRIQKHSFSSRGQPIHEFPILAGSRQARFHFIQPPMFWTRALWERTGGLDERYHYVMDLEWCNRALAAGATVQTSDQLLARFALHPGSKSQDQMERFHREEARMYVRLARTPGFRVLACALATLKPVGRVFAHRYAAARRRGSRVTALVYAVAARVLHVARRAFLRLYASPAFRRQWSWTRRS